MKNAKKRSPSKGSSTKLVRPNKSFPATVAAPVAYSTSFKTKAPTMIQSSKGMRVKHRELVQTVNGSVAFTATKIACNPGIAATFPWLSVIAAQWEQYRFHKLQFDYITRTSTATTGSVLLAPDYDASDVSPATEAQVSTYADCVEDVPWRDICCRLRPESMFEMGPRKFVRSGAVAGTDIKTYDAANLFLCTVEEAGTTAIGKLWVEYDVELFVPQSGSSGSSVTPSSSVYTRHASQALTTATPAAIAFDTSLVDGLSFGAGAAGVFTPPQGNYLVSAQVTVQDTAVEVIAVELGLYKNGAPLLSPVKAKVYDGANVGPNSLTQTVIFGYVSCNGTDTVQLEVTATGAAGTLTIPADYAQVSFTLA